MSIKCFFGFHNKEWVNTMQTFVATATPQNSWSEIKLFGCKRCGKIFLQQKNVSFDRAAELAGLIDE